MSSQQNTRRSCICVFPLKTSGSLLLSVGALMGCDQKHVSPPTAPPPVVTAATAPNPAAPAVAPVSAPAAAASSAPTAATAPPPAAAGAVPPPVPPVANAVPQVPAAKPTTCEVEFFGSVKYAKPIPAGQKFWVYAAEGDCLAKGAKILASTPVNPEGRFGYEVFSGWGVDLSFCAALAEAPDKPTSVYGKAKGKFHAEATGEVYFRDIEISPQPGPKRGFVVTGMSAPGGHPPRPM